MTSTVCCYVFSMLLNQLSEFSRSWRNSSLSYSILLLGSGLSRSPGLLLGSLFVCGLSFYLDVVDSHLLLSLAGLVCCDTVPTLRLNSTFWVNSRFAKVSRF